VAAGELEEELEVVAQAGVAEELEVVPEREVPGLEPEPVQVVAAGLELALVRLQG
jgi:hypothetical protein